jgi:hypothetical protein
MSLRTLERDAPSLFKHGTSPTTRVLLLSALSVMLMLADVRFKLTEPVRQAVSVVLFPLQWAVMQPVGWLSSGKDYFGDLHAAQAEAVRATGGSWFQLLAWGVLPQVKPRLIGLSAYRLDINFRESAVLGLVGAGGIGDTLNTSFDRYEFDTAAAVLIVIIVIVLACEYSSGWIRRKVQ